MAEQTEFSSAGRTSWPQLTADEENVGRLGSASRERGYVLSYVVAGIGLILTLFLRIGR